MENKDKQNSQSVALSYNNHDLGLDIVRDREVAFEFFKDLLKGRSYGITTPTEAMMVYGRCRELDLPFMSTIDHMSILGGKVCADIHIKTALALRAGNSLYWEKIQDYEPQYKYTDGVNEWTSPHKPIKFMEELRKEDPVAAKLQYAWDADSTKDAVDAGKTPFGNAISHNTPFNYVTAYKFYRTRKLITGEFKTIEAIGRFSTMEGHIAKLGYGKKGSDYEGVRDPNSNWGKYEPRMVDIRAYDNGLKVIGGDLTMGMPEISEMAEVSNVNYVVDDAGNAQTIIDIEAVND